LQDSAQAPEVCLNLTTVSAKNSDWQVNIPGQSFAVPVDTAITSAGFNPYRGWWYAKASEPCV
jgi:hypothetical protein